MDDDSVRPAWFDSMTPSIDLNADVGEGVGNDEAIFPLVTSANIACGAHAGDDETMRRCVALALQCGVAIGAHPGHFDRANFGRVEIDLNEQEAHKLVAEQVLRLTTIATEGGAAVRYVKPHGALYHQASRDEVIARGVIAAVRACDPMLAVLGPPGSQLAQVAATLGVRFYREAFVDRAYEPDGSLTPRSLPDALLHGERASAQAVRLAGAGRATARDGSPIKIACDSLCLHGDTPGAVENACAVRTALTEAGIAVQAFSA